MARAGRVRSGPGPRRVGRSASPPLAVTGREELMSTTTGAARRGPTMTLVPLVGAALGAVALVCLALWALPGPHPRPSPPAAYRVVDDGPPPGEWCTVVRTAVGPGRDLPDLASLLALAAGTELVLRLPSSAAPPGPAETGPALVAALVLLSAGLVPLAVAEEWAVVRAALAGALHGRGDGSVGPAVGAAEAVDRHVARWC